MTHVGDATIPVLGGDVMGCLNFACIKCDFFLATSDWLHVCPDCGAQVSISFDEPIDDNDWPQEDLGDAQAYDDNSESEG